MSHYRTTEEVERLITTAAAYMRLKLAENRAKPHWRDQTGGELLRGLTDELYEVDEALDAFAGRLPTTYELEALRREAADVHNYLEMLIDWYAWQLRETGQTRGG